MERSEPGTIYSIPFISGVTRFRCDEEHLPPGQSAGVARISDLPMIIIISSDPCGEGTACPVMGR